MDMSNLDSSSGGFLSVGGFFLIYLYLRRGRHSFIARIVLSPLVSASADSFAVRPLFASIGVHSG
jgi:hypothetical protein